MYHSCVTTRWKDEKTRPVALTDHVASRTLPRMGLRPSEGVVARDMGRSAVLIHLESDRIFELNATGARIWSLIQQGLDREAICSRLRADYKAAPDDIEASVDELLAALLRERLVGE